MKTKWFVLIITGWLISACTEIDQLWPKSSFTDSFPKKKRKNFSSVLGSKFSLKTGNDTIAYTVSFSRGSRINTVIRANSNDTVFSGTINQYKGLYYFNTELNDTTYWIHAVEIRDGTVKGLETAMQQMLAMDYMIEAGKYLELIDKMNLHKGYIRLNPDKNLLRDAYSSILAGYSADTLIK